MPQDHREFIRRWCEEVWNNGRAAAIDEMMAVDAVTHGFGEKKDVSTFKVFHAAYRDAFPRSSCPGGIKDGKVVEGWNTFDSLACCSSLAW